MASLWQLIPTECIQPSSQSNPPTPPTVTFTGSLGNGQRMSLRHKFSRKFLLKLPDYLKLTGKSPFS